MSSVTGSSASMCAVDMYPDPGSLASKTSNQMIRFNLFDFLRAGKCSSIFPEKTTENSIQIVSTPSLHMSLVTCQASAYLWFQWHEATTVARGNSTSPWM